jgi:hypothetical protein
VTAVQLLRELRQLGVRVEVDCGRLRTRPAEAVPQALRPLLVEHRDAVINLILQGCQHCGEVDYLPLARGWCRCWACGTRWGQGRDPGGPPDLGRVADLLDLRMVEQASSQLISRRSGGSIGAVLLCPYCGNRAYSIPLAGQPHRRCEGPRGCGGTWNPEVV